MMEEGFKATGMLLVPPQTTAITSTTTIASQTVEQKTKMLMVAEKNRADHWSFTGRPSEQQQWNTSDGGDPLNQEAVKISQSHPMKTERFLLKLAKKNSATGDGC